MRERDAVFETGLHWTVYGWPALWTLVLVGFPLLLLAAARDLTAWFSVTARHLVVRGGLLRGRRELPIDRLASIEVRQGWLGRRLDYGTVVLATDAERLTYKHVARPHELKKAANSTRFRAISR